MERCCTSAIIFLVSARDWLLAWRINFSQKEFTAFSISFLSKIKFTIPKSLAALAEIISPVSNKCLAFPSPIFRNKKIITIAGIKPIFTSLNPKVDSGVAKEKSQTVAKPHPPAIAAPSICATTTFEE